MFSKLSYNLCTVCTKQCVVASNKVISVTLPNRCYGVYAPDYVNPRPDLKYYVENPPQEGDEPSLKKFKAAPNSQNYSVMYEPTIDKFQLMILKEGKGLLADKIMKSTLERIKLIQLKKYHAADENERHKIEVNPCKVFCDAFENMKPVVDMYSIRHGASKYQVPYPMTPEQQFFKAAKWLLNHIRKGKPSSEASQRIASEIMAAYNDDGEVIRKKLELHKLADANRAYAHFNWKSKK